MRFVSFANSKRVAKIARVLFGTTEAENIKFAGKAGHQIRGSALQHFEFRKKRYCNSEVFGDVN